MMKKVKILFILPQAQQGGAETQLFNLLTRINKNLFEVYLGVLYKNQQLDKEFNSIDGVTVSYFDKGGGVDLGIYFRIARFLKEKDIDIVQTFLGNHHGYLPTMIAGKSIAIGGIRSTYDKKDTFIKKLLNYTLPKLLAKKGKLILVSNSYTGKELYVKQGIPEKKISVIPNGIDYERFSKGDKAKIISELKLQNKLVLGIVARIDKRKNHNKLIEIFSELHKEHPNMVLLIVGSGDYLENLKKQVESLNLVNEVKFTGNRKDIPDILSAMDIFVFPSLFPEGWPNSVGEAMAAGLPVISYPVGDISHIIQNGYDGIITKPNNKFFKSKLIYLIENKDRRKHLGLNARQTIINKFSVMKMVDSYESLYLGLIKKRGNVK